jgi:predicted Ser/Thr protein kinase
MASVYKAYEPALDRYVALKVLPAEFLHDETFAERFQREAKVIAKLEHPKIVPIFGFGIDQGVPWMAMRLVAGGTLAGILKGGRLAPSRVVAILRGVAQALDYAHEKGVIHRDVKPQNVLLDDAERVYLADFGIARMMEGSTALTATGMITGTPQYMSPEQAQGQHVDHRTDIYALGIVAYEMLVGKVPFSADTPVAVLLKHLQAPMPLPAPSECSEPLVRVLLKCTAKAADDRWPTASAFVDALETGSGEGLPASIPTMVTASVEEMAVPTLRSRSAAPPQASPTMATPPVRRRSVVQVGVAVGAAAFLVMALSVAWLSRRPEKEPAAPPAAPTETAVVITPPPAPPSTPAAIAPPATVAASSAAAPDAARTVTDEQAPAKLAIDFEHGLKSGTLRVWVDEDLVLNTRLESREKKKLIAFKSRKGAVTEVLEVKPGSHDVRVQVTWDDKVKTETVSGNFRSGVTRKLDVRVGGLKKNLSVGWN